MKFHINPDTGDVGQCKAQKQCRFGGAAAHYKNADDARAAYEEAQSSELSPKELSGPALNLARLTPIYNPEATDLEVLKPRMNYLRDRRDELAHISLSDITIAEADEYNGTQAELEMLEAVWVKKRANALRNEPVLQLNKYLKKLKREDDDPMLSPQEFLEQSAIFLALEQKA